MTLLAEQFATDACDRNDVYAAACPCREMLDVLANKWSALAIGLLEDGPLRFGELRRGLQGISPKVLSATLKKLEDAGLVDREVFPEVPPRVQYSLTALGVSAAAPLGMLRDWVDRNVTRH
ncbi:helix-turn-helix domain-containing protein [Leifsonia sp. NPDC080035]|uniref:Helix-turn-helix domain-containing protein n=1 Tax=Leifsonia sp. NPDC080035 TaxID=3143936 RepID=A0AAU7GD38_9MICO